MVRLDTAFNMYAYDCRKMEEFVPIANGICPKGPSVWGRNIRGRSVGGVQMSLGSKCGWGRNVPGVEMSVGSKCQWGQSVFGVEMGVNQIWPLQPVKTMQGTPLRVKMHLRNSPKRG